MSKRVHDETVPESEAVDVKEESTKEEVKDGKTETTVDAKDDAEESSTKKQKVDETPGKPVRKRQFAKKKVALLFAYCGLDYQGLQINPNAKTVEGILIEALNKVNAIPDHHVSSLQKIQFMRACRTDKGVSALGNVISFKMQYNDAESLDTVRDRVNELLPPHVKLFHIYRTLGGFHCKNAVDYRVYEYICPTYAFVPIIAGSGAKFTTEMLEKVRQLFTVYEGTHNYHNFTTGKDAEDADANRYIKSITVSDPFVLDDIELVKIQLTGQSFVLNQIRKMIGLVIYAMRYTGSFKTIVYVLKETRYVHFVMAPGEFLYLERAAYNGYNRKLDNVKSDLPRIDFRQFQDERDAFKTLYVYAPVLAKEKSEKIMRTYLSTVDRGHIGIDKENVDIINWIKDLESKEIEWVKQAKKNETNPDWQ